jgi:hypothetical protein
MIEKRRPCHFSILEFLLYKNSINTMMTAASRGEPSPLCGLVEYTVLPRVMVKAAVCRLK